MMPHQNHAEIRSFWTPSRSRVLGRVWEFTLKGLLGLFGCSSDLTELPTVPWESWAVKERADSKIQGCTAMLTTNSRNSHKEEKVLPLVSWNVALRAHWMGLNSCSPATTPKKHNKQHNSLPPVWSHLFRSLTAPCFHHPNSSAWSAIAKLFEGLISRRVWELILLEGDLPKAFQN